MFTKRDGGAADQVES